MHRSSPVDGFRLAYDRVGSGPPVVLLHGWPGDRCDYRDVLPLLDHRVEIVVPDLRGFGESDKHLRPPRDAYSGAAQADSVIALIEELGWREVVLGGYDVGSRVAQVTAQTRPELVASLVICPPVPGAGERVLGPISVPTTILWPAHDPLFPPAWSDRLDRYFSDATLNEIADAGHFVPLEAPHAFAEAIKETAARRRRPVSDR